MKVSRALLALSFLSLCLSLSACIDRTSGSGPYSTALTRLRELGVPDRFSDELLVSLASEACAMPPGARAAEFEPLIFRRLTAAGIEIDTGAAALVEMLYAGGAGLCVEATSPAPGASPGSRGATYADLTADLEAVRATLLSGSWLALTQLANPSLSVPSTGVLRIDGEAPAGTESQAGCTAVIVLGSLYSFLLTPVELAVLTGDPDPVVQIAVGSAPILDSSPGGLSELSRRCFGLV